MAMVLVVPFLGGEAAGPADVLVAVGKAIGIVVVVVIASRTVVPSLLRSVAGHQSSEVFLLTVLAICFGTAYLSSLLDISVSLGAFLAGLMVSETRVAARALGEVMPLQILFSATFFVSIGMLLDLGYVLSNVMLIVALAVGVVAVKLLTTAVAAAALRQPRAVVVSSALILAQIGEFSFVLERAGEQVGLIPAGLPGGTDAFSAVTVLLMAISTYRDAPGGDRHGEPRRQRARRDGGARRRNHGRSPHRRRNLPERPCRGDGIRAACPPHPRRVRTCIGPLHDRLARRAGGQGVGTHRPFRRRFTPCDRRAGRSPRRSDGASC